MRGVLIGVALVATGLAFVGLGSAPFLDPPEGFHAAVARGMAAGDWITPRVNGVPYFDKPPLLYWLLSASFAVAGPTPFAARVPSALAAVGCAVLTCRIGVLLGGPRLGFLAGLMTVANLGVFLYGRLVKPDLVFILCIFLGFAGFVLAYTGTARGGLLVFYTSLGLAVMTKDILGAVGPLAVVAVFLVLTRERPLAPWLPWWGGLLVAALTLPWYLAIERRHPGFIWYTVVDNHVLNLTRQRLFPDEDVPLGALEFLGATALGFLPWAPAVPWAIARALRRPWASVTDRLWVLFGLWAAAVIVVFTVSPFKLPHYGLPAFPALALLVARVWDESIDARPGSVRPRTLLVPLLGVFAAAAAAFAAAWAGILPIPDEALTTVDLASRNLAARGQAVPGAPREAYLATLVQATIVCTVASGVIAVAAVRRSPALGAGAALAAMIAFLPAAGEGMAQFARGRSAATVSAELVRRLGAADIVVHEGPLENGASVLLLLSGPVHIVDGLQSNLAFGATEPATRDIFWDAERLRAAWRESGRRFLLTAVAADRSVVRSLPPGTVHLLAQGGGRRLYSNVAD